MKRNSLLIITLVFFSFYCAQGLKAQDDLNLNQQIKGIDSSSFFSQEGYYVWCTSVIRGEDNKYHMLYSRWPHGTRALDDDSMNYIFNGFRGWNKYSEIAYAVADKINGPYTYVKTILKGDGDPDKWDRYTMHNPQVKKFGQYYFLYYISNNFDSNLYKHNNTYTKEWKHWLRYNSTQKIGVVKFKNFTDLVKGEFSRTTSPLIEPDSIHTFEVANNPTVTQGPNGKYYMMYKSRKPNVGTMTFWMAISDQPDGPFTMLGEVFTSEEMACEDPSIWYDHKRKRFYAAAKYYSNKKILATQHGALVLITSEDGIQWTAANHSLISLRELPLIGGRKMELAHLERPFVITDKKGKAIGMFAAASIEEPSSSIVNPSFKQNTFSIYIPFFK